MALLIRRLSADDARPDQTVEGEFTVGRGTDNTVVLPGLLVALHHLRVRPLSALRLYVECLGRADIVVNGVAGRRSAEVAAGDELRVGANRVRVGFDADNEQLILEIHEHDPGRAAERVEALTSLGEAGWRMRRPAYWSAGTILVLLLLLPLVLKYVPASAALGHWLPSDHLWSPGRVSNVHAQFQDRCETCHVGVFQQVRDESCLACHAATAQHGDDAAAMTQAGLDQRRCASCHFEHGGEHAVMPSHPGICTDCHATPKKFPSLAGSGTVEDFGEVHPAFKVSFIGRTDSTPKAMRETLSKSIRDHSGLIFPHDVHLNAKGVRDAEGKTEILACVSCHAPDPTEAGFRPQRYANDCQRCHQLDVHIGGVPLLLPHGDNAAARSLLEAAVKAKPVSTEPYAAESDQPRRPGDLADRGKAEGGPDETEEVFEIRVCAKCHEIDRIPGKPLAVRPPDLRQSWMSMARFTHAPHKWVACDSCHAAENSANSDDLMLPQIDTCRSCHGGVDSSTQIPSTCIDCHRFHRAKTPWMDAQFGKKGKPANGEAFDKKG
ncbi:MAG: cytochrome c3 family protein [Panacagrimonas sp.]